MSAPTGVIQTSVDTKQKGEASELEDQTDAALLSKIVPASQMEGDEVAKKRTAKAQRKTFDQKSKTGSSKTGSNRKEDLEEDKEDSLIEEDLSSGKFSFTSRYTVWFLEEDNEDSENAASKTVSRKLWSPNVSEKTPAPNLFKFYSLWWILKWQSSSLWIVPASLQ